MRDTSPKPIIQPDGRPGYSCAYVWREGRQEAMTDDDRTKMKQRADFYRPVLEGTYTIDPNRYDRLVEEAAVAYTQDIPALLDDHARLEAENAALRTIAQAVVNCDVDDYDRCCLYTDDCDPRWDDGHWRHTADCPVTRARALLAKDAR